MRSDTCLGYVVRAVQETEAKNEPLLEEPNILSDELQDRLETISKDSDLDTVYQIIITAAGWDDSYAPLTTNPQDMLRQLAYACLIDTAKYEVSGLA